MGRAKHCSSEHVFSRAACSDKKNNEGKSFSFIQETIETIHMNESIVVTADVEMIVTADVERIQ